MHSNGFGHKGAKTKRIQLQLLVHRLHVHNACCSINQHEYHHDTSHRTHCAHTLHHHSTHLPTVSSAKGVSSLQTQEKIPRTVGGGVTQPKKKVRKKASGDTVPHPYLVDPFAFDCNRRRLDDLPYLDCWTCNPEVIKIQWINRGNVLIYDHRHARHCGHIEQQWHAVWGRVWGVSYNMPDDFGYKRICAFAKHDCVCLADSTVKDQQLRALQRERKMKRGMDATPDTRINILLDALIPNEIEQSTQFKQSKKRNSGKEIPVPI